MSFSTPSPSVPSLVAGAHAATSQATFAARRNAFRALHQRGCFVIPNPWDVGSARYLQHLGFAALATTSAGFAFSQGLPDSGDDVVVSRDRNLAYIAAITTAVDLPVSADFMSGYGMKPEDVAESVARCVATGVAGLSIEDATGDSSSPLYHLPIAVERVRAARRAIDRCGDDVLLTARAECYHVGHPDPFRESVRRLQARLRRSRARADATQASSDGSPAARRRRQREPREEGYDNFLRDFGERFVPGYGGAPATLAPGQTWYEGPDDVHVVSRNASNSAPAKYLVFMVKDKGAPILTPVK